MRLSLRSGEKLYVNGAVFSVDRRVSIDLLNNATFLLENHILQAKDATTPLRQLYFVVQLLLIDPASAPQTRAIFDSMLQAELDAFDDPLVLDGLRIVRTHVEDSRPFDALRKLRDMYAVEGKILRGAPSRAA